MKRITIAVLGLVIGTAAGCKDLGLDGNIPLEEAQDRPPSALVAAVMAPVEPVSERLVVDGRLWIPSGMPLTLQESDLRAVGSATGRTVYARRWDESPYDALFVRLAAADPSAPAGAVRTGGGEWIELQPVRGRSGRVPGEGEGAAPAPAPAGEHGGH